MELHTLVESLSKEFKNFKENHFHHLSLDVYETKNDIKWLKKVGGAALAVIISLLIKLLMK